MGRRKRTTRRVTAQRKFAQGAYVPPMAAAAQSSAAPAAAAPADRTHPAPQNTDILYNNMPIAQLLDMVCFNNVHNHSNQPIVLLERLRGKPLLQKEKEKLTQAMVKLKERISNKGPKTNRRVAKAISKKNNHEMHLRSRPLHVHTKYSPPPVLPLKRKLSRMRPPENQTIPESKRKCIRRGKMRDIPTPSDFSVDDNRPLTYFAKCSTPKPPSSPSKDWAVPREERSSMRVTVFKMPQTEPRRDIVTVETPTDEIVLLDTPKAENSILTRSDCNSSQQVSTAFPRLRKVEEEPQPGPSGLFRPPPSRRKLIANHPEVYDTDSSYEPSSRKLRNIPARRTPPPRRKSTAIDIKYFSSDRESSSPASFYGVQGIHSWIDASLSEDSTRQAPRKQLTLRKRRTPKKPQVPKKTQLPRKSVMPVRIEVPKTDASIQMSRDLTDFQETEIVQNDQIRGELFRLQRPSVSQSEKYPIENHETLQNRAYQQAAINAERVLQSPGEALRLRSTGVSQSEKYLSNIQETVPDRAYQHAEIDARRVLQSRGEPLRLLSPGVSQSENYPTANHKTVQDLAYQQAAIDSEKVLQSRGEALRLLSPGVSQSEKYSSKNHETVPDRAYQQVSIDARRVLQSRGEPLRLSSMSSCDWGEYTVYSHKSNIESQAIFQKSLQSHGEALSLQSSEICHSPKYSTENHEQDSSHIESQEIEQKNIQSRGEALSLQSPELADVPKDATETQETRCTGVEIFKRALQRHGGFSFTEDIQKQDMDADEEDYVLRYEMSPTCPSESWTTLKDVVNASKAVFNSRCKECRACERIEKIVKLSNLLKRKMGIESSGKEGSDLESYRPAIAYIDTQTEGSVSETRDENGKLVSDGHRNILLYLDLSPQHSHLMIKVKMHTMHRKQMFSACFIPRSEANNKDELVLKQHEHLLDQLIEILTLNMSDQPLCHVGQLSSRPSTPAHVPLDNVAATVFTPVDVASIPASSPASTPVASASIVPCTSFPTSSPIPSCSHTPDTATSFLRTCAPLPDRTPISAPGSSRDRDLTPSFIQTRAASPTQSSVTSPTPGCNNDHHDSTPSSVRTRATLRSAKSPPSPTPGSSHTRGKASSSGRNRARSYAQARTDTQVNSVIAGANLTSIPSSCSSRTRSKVRRSDTNCAVETAGEVHSPTAGAACSGNVSGRAASRTATTGRSNTTSRGATHASSRGASRVATPGRKRATSRAANSARKRTANRATTPARKRSTSRAASPARKRSTSRTATPARSRARSRAATLARSRARSGAATPARGRARSRAATPAHSRATSHAAAPAHSRATSRAATPGRRRASSRAASPARSSARSRTSTPVRSRASSRAASPGRKRASNRAATPARSRATSRATSTAHRRVSSRATTPDRRRANSHVSTPDRRSVSSHAATPDRKRARSSHAATPHRRHASSSYAATPDRMRASSSHAATPDRRRASSHATTPDRMRASSSHAATPDRRRASSHAASPDRIRATSSHAATPDCRRASSRATTPNRRRAGSRAATSGRSRASHRAVTPVYSIASSSATTPGTSRTSTPAADLHNDTVEKEKGDSDSDRGSPRPSGSRTNNGIIDAPIFWPTKEEFVDPIAYIEKIWDEVAEYGICKIVPPEGFEPPCKADDDIRFEVSNQYVSRLYSRWGSAAKDFCAIKSCLKAQNISYTRPPQLEGMEVNLPRLYKLVQKYGGLETVINKKRWGKVAEEMNLTKNPFIERKLDQIYAKYLLPWATLSNDERTEYLQRAEAAWKRKQRKLLKRAKNPLYRKKHILGETESSEEETEEDEVFDAEDCVKPGVTMNLAKFKKVARSAFNTFFRNRPVSATEIEEEYWRLMIMTTEHVSVNSAAIDTAEQGLGFPKHRLDGYSNHPWNLKRLTEHRANVLRAMGPVLGVTVPTLHLGMVFSTSCWHRDPHAFSWMEYEHSGPVKIWYGLPESKEQSFRIALEVLNQTSCQNKQLWLSSDIAMVPPAYLQKLNVPLYRVEQNPGEFVLVMPKAYSCAISTGFTISESTYLATEKWLDNIISVFRETRESCEPTMFSIEQLLKGIAEDPRTTIEMLQKIRPVLEQIILEELANRTKLARLGVKVKTERFEGPHHQPQPSTSRGYRQPGPRAPTPPPPVWDVRDQDECECCRCVLYLSKVKHASGREATVCLEHAIKLIESSKNKVPVPEIELITAFTTAQLEEVIDTVRRRLEIDEV